MELIDPALLDNIRREGIMLRSGEIPERFCYIYGRWRFFYSLHGINAPENCTDENNDNLPDYVERILCKLERGYTLLRDLFELVEPLRDDLRYIDIVLDDIPTLSGVAVGRAKNTEHAILANTPYEGRALGVRLHRCLIDQTATPMHELFHLYQYWYVPFINGWFMEGLATCYHRIFKNYAAREEDLPSTATELANLVLRKHDAEAFWSRLFRLCDNRNSEVPRPYCDYFEIKQTHFHGRIFLKNLLEILSREYKPPSQEEFPAVGKMDHRSLLSNNTLIFSAILRTIKTMQPEENEELSKFVALLGYYTDVDFAPYNTPPIQRLMHDLRNTYDICPVYEHKGILHSPYFDPLTGTLTVATLHVLAEPPESFNCIRRIQGSLHIEVAQSAVDRNLSALEAIIGTLAISNSAILTGIDGFDALKEIGGGLHVENNPALETINGFKSLQSIKQNFRLSACARLGTISGISQLSGVGGTLEINDLPALKDIRFLQYLENANDLLITKCPIADAEPLRLLFARNPEFKGSIRITETLITDLRFLSPVRGVGSSFYLNQNRIECLDGLEQLQYVGASFSLASNRITNLAPLRALRKVDGILSVANNALTSLAGLESLTSLRTKKWGNTPSTLRIYGNPGLHDISAISNIETSDHYLVLHLDQTQTFTTKPVPSALFHRNILQIQDFRSGAIVPTYDFVAKSTHDYRRFWNAVQNNELEFMVDLETDADTLVISFSGLFNNKYPWIVDGIKTHKILVADRQSMWYHGGITGITKDIDGTLSLVKSIAQARPYKHIVCFGISMGAYMAMLTGWLIKAHHVIAFSPQTCLDLEIVHSFGDHRFDRYLNKLPGTINLVYLDLEKLFSTYQNDETQIQIHYSSELHIEKLYVDHLMDRPNIRKFTYEIYDQYLTRGLLEADALNMEAFLAFEPVQNDRYEYMDGEVSAIADETPAHMTISLNVAAWLYNHFRNNRFRVHMAHMKLHVEAVNAFLYPDVFVTSADSVSQSRTHLDGALLVVDVLTGSAQAYDKGSKFYIYRKIPTLREYVAIEAESQQVRIWCRDGGEWVRYELPHGADLKLESLEVTIPAAILFANL